MIMAKHEMTDPIYSNAAPLSEERLEATHGCKWFLFCFYLYDWNLHIPVSLESHKDDTLVPLYSFVKDIANFRLLSSYVLKEKLNQKQKLENLTTK